MTCDKSTGLVLYAAMGYDSDAAKAFQEQTGIPVKLVDDSTGPLLAKVAAESNNPQWDVIWFDGDVTMASLDQQGYLLKWDSTAIDNYTATGKSVLPSDHSYYPTGVTAAGAIIYNTSKVPGTGLPKDWSDLTKPEYKNLVAENDPAFSGPAYPFIAGIYQLMNQDGAQKFFSQLKANSDQIFQTNKPTLNSIETGAREFGIVQDTVYYAAVHAGQKNLGIIYPSSGVVAMPSVIGIAAKGQHQGCAEQFVNWVLSSAGQKVTTNHDPSDGDTYYIPLINGVESMVKRATPADGTKFISLDTQKYASEESNIKKWFHDNVVQ
ncbi:MAG: hypothetical protein BGO39_01515 [Chloroflexi bacterium 54-19]|nr:MAG: hypothetical protein BGO39_01515 [Chloroflexi bacterium 54-19]